LHNHQITRQRFSNPSDLVSWMGAMQGQDHHGAKWAMGLRLQKGSDASVEEAITNRTIIRTYLMRGRLHVVTGRDSRWLLSLTAPRMIAASSRREKQLDLDDRAFSQVRDVVTASMEGGRQCTRAELYSHLEGARISTRGQRGHHILWRMAMEGLICFAAPEGIQQTFALLDEWVPETRWLDKTQALGELALRYFTSRGPATLQDFTWWSGLSTADAQAGLEMVRSKLVSANLGGQTFWMSTATQIPPSGCEGAYLLPSFDEFLLGYQNRTAVLDTKHAAVISPGGDGTFLPAIVLNGSVVGVWGRTIRNGAMDIRATAFTSFGRKDLDLIQNAVARYAEFMGLKADLVEAEAAPKQEVEAVAPRLQVKGQGPVKEFQGPLRKLG
jgi:hypothetical protein